MPTILLIFAIAGGVVLGGAAGVVIGRKTKKLPSLPLVPPPQPLLSIDIESSTQYMGTVTAWEPGDHSEGHFVDFKTRQPIIEHRIALEVHVTSSSKTFRTSFILSNGDVMRCSGFGVGAKLILSVGNKANSNGIRYAHVMKYQRHKTL